MHSNKLYTTAFCKMKQTSQIWYWSSAKIWNRMQPRVLAQNQHTRELISTRKMSHKHINKTLTWHVCHEDVPLVEFMYLVFTRIPGESYRWWLGSLLLHLCDVFRVLINSLVCWFRSININQLLTDVPLVEFMYLVFIRMPGESYHWHFWSLLLYLCTIVRALINSLVCWFLADWV